MRSNVKIELKEFDIKNFKIHEDFFNSLTAKPLRTNVVTRYMAEQKECENDLVKILNIINVNHIGMVSILNIIANEYEKNKNGFIEWVSSVAGGRGRKANYIYGSSKAMFTAYLAGLRNRLYES
ncbi:MAG: SDR family NAD(P)-dependent oxidoreductase [Pseudomonadota bacterium]|nr:SDR family NAD(P)-dependent oxidoreductase [Pseudomonadota bacterium]